VAAIVAPLQMLIGDTVARTVFQEMPIKFAAIEIVWTTGPDQPEIILGRLNQDTGVVEGGLPIPGMASYLSGFSTSTVITGLSTVSRADQPPANIVHWAWDGMVFGGSALALLSLWFIVYWLFRRRLPGTPWFYRCAAIAGALSVFCVECGWIVTEVGRQPWIIYGVLRTAAAVTNAGFVRAFGVVVVIVYVLIATATVLTLRAMSRRWRAGDPLEAIVPYGPPEERPLAAAGTTREER
jgi:cytochrome d ubiquinol oxidase subunit I